MTCTYVNMHANTFFNMQLIHLLISHLNINKLHVNIDKLHFNRNNNKNISMSTSIVAFSIFIPHADINKLQFDMNTLHFACYKSYVVFDNFKNVFRIWFLIAFQYTVNVIMLYLFEGLCKSTVCFHFYTVCIHLS